MVAYKIDQDLHALWLSLQLTDHFMQLFLSLTSITSPFFEQALAETPSEMTLCQSGQIFRKLELLILLAHQSEVEGFNI